MIEESEVHDLHLDIDASKATGADGISIQKHWDFGLMVLLYNSLMLLFNIIKSEIR